MCADIHYYFINAYDEDVILSALQNEELACTVITSLDDAVSMSLPESVTPGVIATLLLARGQVWVPRNDEYALVQFFDYDTVLREPERRAIFDGHEREIAFVVHSTSPQLRKIIERCIVNFDVRTNDYSND